MRIRSIVSGLVLAGVLVNGAAQASAYMFTDLGTLGGANSLAYGINNANQVVGQAYNQQGQARATLWSGGTTINLGTLGGTESTAYSINNSGQIAGWARTTGDAYVQATVWNNGVATNLSPTTVSSFSMATAINDNGMAVGHFMSPGFYSQASLWDGKIMTGLENLGGSSNGALAINNFGQVVGYGRTAGDSSLRATLWENGLLNDLGTLGGTDSIAQSINDIGQVVGAIYDSHGKHASLWNSGSSAAILDAPDGAESIALDINNSGRIVGEAKLSGETEWRAFIWVNGIAIDLNSFLDTSDVIDGWVLREARSINDNGWIVGTAENSKLGIRHAFILSANTIPEPNSLVLLVLAFACMAVVRHRLQEQTASKLL